MLKLPLPYRLLGMSAMISLGILAACATQAPTVEIEPSAPTIVVSNGCTAFPRITYSRKLDTDETIKQVREYNAARDAICGAGK